MRAIVLGFLLLIGSASPALAFGEYGHITVCEMAYRMLSDTSRAELNRILLADGEYKAFNRACTDEDNPPRLRSSEHFLNLPRTRLAVTGADCFAQPKCVVSAIEGDWAVLRSPTSSDMDKAKALKGIGHWVGDIHQPLHISYADDRGGNFVRKTGPCSSNNLHSVWDSCIIERRVFNFGLLERTLGWGKYTKVYRASDRILSTISPADKRAWQASQPWEWAAESYVITIRPDVGYCVQKDGACWYDESRRELERDGPQRTFTVTDEYLDLQAPVVEKRLAQAAVRLAHVLNTAFDPAYVPA